MSDTFRHSTGRKLVSRANARELGAVNHLLVDSVERRVAAIVVGKGKNAKLVDWAQLSSFGPDAIMVGDELALHPPVDDRERAAADGKLELLGKRALTEGGNELGVLDDVTFDPQTGAIEMLRVGTREIPAGSLLGSGSYAVILDAGQDPAS
jgi:uncharacterized protein YrrD